MYSSLLKLEKKHVSLAVEVLSDSFMDNPMVIYLFPWAKIRKRILPAAFNNVVMHVVNKGEIYATSEKMEGIIWLEHKGDPTPDLVKALIKATVHTYPQLLPFLLKRAAKIKNIGLILNNYYKKPIDFVRISLIAVNKEQRGKKFMSQMVRAILNIVENTNIYCLVETETESNVEIYQHFGFNLVEKIEEVKGNLNFFVLIYDPHFLVSKPIPEVGKN